jgi:hypothetical protein
LLLLWMLFGNSRGFCCCVGLAAQFLQLLAKEC